MDLPKEARMLYRMFKDLVDSDQGASMVEYGLLVVLIAIAGLVAVSYFGDSVGGTYSTIADDLATAGQ